MTTTRINHTGHNHPATPAGRAACRDAISILMADMVVLRNRVIKFGKLQPNSTRWADACDAYDDTVKAYAELTGMSRREVSEKVIVVMNLLPRR
jgi:hypothetical protein